MSNENTFKLLSKINSPADLRKLSIDELPVLCNELRKDIIQEVAVNPGHLASSLGAIEITVACHYVFNTPEDRIVWDVGHQAYGHKILTNRRESFCKNRKKDGLMPFPSPKESEYDTFTCGHASNSISAALGMAVAAKMTNHPERHVVAIIGDGAMSGGLAFEGLNNASSQPNDLLIILNDNDMSIDRAVGGMQQYLLNLDTNETYNKFRFKASQWLHSKGLLNDKRRKGIIRLNNAIKSALAQQQNLFEGMNIRYFGPFDGNDVKEVVRLLRQLKDMKGPKLLHLHTIKGKGYEPAEKSATVWHAPGKFIPETGKRLVQDNNNKPPKFQDVFGHTLLELARKNPRIVGVTPAMPTGCSMSIMMKEMADRTFDVGIAEGHAMTFSAGMAKDGLQPFCNIYSAFSQRAYDNIIHDTAILNLPVVLCLDRAGLVGEDGATHHGAFDMAFLRPIPGITIASPMNEHELRRLMYTAQLPQKGFFVIRYPRGCGSLVDWLCPLEEIKVGTGRKLYDKTLGNEHKDCTKNIAILTIGPIGNDAQKAIEEIEQEGKYTGRITLYDMRFLKPIDKNILEEVGKNFSEIITIEDGVINGGLGTTVIEWLNEHNKNIHVQRLGLPDHFIEQGTVAELRELCGFDKYSIKQEIEKRLLATYTNKI
ncbi:MAG: 1-deoxy-D-xylulose-5-phosphate synthase [Prevotella pallens]|jgi:1-deoxy-D-xylulose-5-phosphate synthase|uniref:1-deoxy-D-xylulose-5-phosphate synthase n=1 Tax=Prevotella pallens TaxID=60133 RepID=UPI001CB5AC75|nr:1-deoxy-D-xylulose-5-phosphate synthase [Prevotella pallens]MBF1460633.1 1-deoxy-D-xylulose-5-phosphate synthase [Prevotella pallens]MBF1480850.1 1-deoxy-D-xylulose-5-phosphate synthase [Prevotella pallens]